MSVVAFLTGPAHKLRITSRRLDQPCCESVRSDVAEGIQVERLFDTVDEPPLIASAGLSVLVQSEPSE